MSQPRSHVGQERVIHNWTARPSVASQVHLPTHEGLTRLFVRNQGVSLLRLDDTRPSDATIAHTLPPGSEDRLSESKVQSASLSSFQSWSLPAEISSTSVDSSGFHCCDFGLLPLRRRLIHGKPGHHPSFRADHGRKEAELQCAAPNRRSKIT